MSQQKQPAKRIEIVSLKVVKEKPSVSYPLRTIRSPEDAVELFRNFIGDLDREGFALLCLSTKNEPTALHMVSTGTLNSSLVHPREAYKLAILANSSAVIACHNHPSGHADPSREDIEMTKRLKEAGELLGIDFLDHIIIGDGCHVSLKEQGLM
jgi:DNA repair protein RadC